MRTIHEVELTDPIVDLVSQLRNTYSHLYSVTSSEEWWYFTPRIMRDSLSQGWKLHLSTIPIHAASLLNAVADVLIQYRIRWKVCLTTDQLLKLLAVPSPVSQVGKFITIYPDGEAQAAELAALLHPKTAQWAGPIVPSDIRYADGSQVYYRYGSFEPRFFYDPISAVLTPYIVTPDGRKVEDDRYPRAHSRDWFQSPFPSIKSVECQPSASNGLFNKGFRVKGLLRQSAKGGVFVVAQGDTTFVLKEARFGTNPDLLGRDSRDRITNEYKVLDKLSSLGIAPQPVELFDAEHNRYIVMEHLAGQSLRAYIEQRNYQGDAQISVLRRICESVIDLVRQCHAAGVIIRDLTPNNLLVTAQGCKLVDLELAYIVDSDEEPFLGATPGYIPFGSEKLGRITPDYDVYALGAVLFFIVTGIHPYLASKVDITLRKASLLHEFLRDTRLSDITELVAQYLSWPIDDVVAMSPPIARPTAIPHASQLSSQPLQTAAFPFDREDLLRNVKASAEELYATADWASSNHLWSAGTQGAIFHPGNFYTGSTGVAYYLCEIAQVTSDPKYYAYAARIMDWTLATHPFDEAETPPGLYFGYAAVPWVLAMIADGLDAPHYREQAIAVAEQIACAPLLQLDITHGAAGVGLMHLELYQRTGIPAQLDRARALAHRIVEQAQEDETGLVIWKNQDRQMWGFAHGIAGLAYYLLAVYAHTGEQQLREVAEKAARSLIQSGLSTANGQGLSWGNDPSRATTAWTHWCNGAAGVGQFFVAAAQILEEPEYEQVALLAANTICLGHSFGSCCQCHGLAGDGDYVLQAYRAFSHLPSGQAVQRIISRLYALRLNLHENSTWLWPSEDGQNSGPDYMVGYCGIYSFLLRAFYPDLRPTLLARLEQSSTHSTIAQMCRS